MTSAGSLLGMGLVSELNVNSDEMKTFLCFPPFIQKVVLHLSNSLFLTEFGENFAGLTSVSIL